MTATERLYYGDSHLTEFEARVTGVTERVSGWTAVTLDRTAFYPTGGGQSSDTGTLNETRVVEWHVMRNALVLILPSSLPRMPCASCSSSAWHRWWRTGAASTR